MRLLSEEEWRVQDFSGERVGVIADGHTAARVLPRVLQSAAAVKVFQGEPTWVLPLRIPVAGKVAARLNLRLSVRDPWTRRRLTPGRFGGQRVTVSRTYYGALRHPRVTLVTWPVYAVTEHGVRTAEGIEHRLDALVITATAREELAT